MTINIKYIWSFCWALCILAISLSSCSREMDEVFTTPATERVKILLDSCKTTLIESTNGWYLRYTTPDGLVSEFIVDFMKHDSLSMYVALNDAFSISSFSMNYGQGPILSFDSYSPLHTLADPEVQPLGYGHQGDFEFVIISVSPDSIVLNGRKNKDRVVLYAANEGKINQIRLEKLLDKMAPIIVGFFHSIDINGSKSDIMLSSDLTTLEFTTSEGKKTSKIKYTTAGFDLIQPFTINGISVNHFIWDSTSKKFKLENIFPLEESKMPNFSIGATASQVIGSLYDVIDCSIAIRPWYETLFNNFPRSMRTEISLNAMTQIITYKTISKTEILSTTNANLIAFSFIFDKENYGTTWDNFKGLNITTPREDRLLITKGAKEGFNAQELYNEQNTKKLSEFIYNSSGITVYLENNYVYLISNSNSKNWLKLEKSYSKTYTQTTYISN